MTIDTEIEGAAQFARVLHYVTSTAWAMTPEMLAVMQEILELRAAGERFSGAEIRARVEAAGPSSRGIGQARAGAVAVLPVHGMIAHRASLMSTSTGGTSVENIRNKLRGALADPNVSAIVLDVDSPGGSVDGVPELAAEIFAARQTKPIVAVANTQTASAAYWLASQASEVIASPSANVGSIGVYGVHEDRSKMMEKRGVKTTLISAGKYKTEASPYAELSDDARSAMQATVNEFYGMFTGDVARGRGVKLAKVTDGMGEGRTVSAGQALKLGMIDKIATLDETVARYKGPGLPITPRLDAGSAPMLRSARSIALGRRLSLS